MPAPRPSLEALRDAFPSLAREAYLNTGGAGPLPLVVARAVERSVDAALRRGRAGRDGYADLFAAHDRLRAALATLLLAGEDEIAIASSSTVAMNMAVWGIDWREGDSLVTTSLEHPGLLAPLAVAADRRGLDLRIVDVGDGDVDLERAVGAVADATTRLVALSHVTYSTGARLDVEGAARAAHAVGALVLVDGAQGVGAIPTDPRALGADAYAVAAHKWLLGPEGLGALWVRRESLERVNMTLSGFSSGSDHAPDGSFTPHPAASRLEASTNAELLVPGWCAALELLADIGWDYVHGRVTTMACEARRLVEGLPGARVLTPATRMAGLVSFTLDGADVEEVDLALSRQGIITRWIPEPRALRVSAGFFTSGADLERMARAISLIASDG